MDIREIEKGDLLALLDLYTHLHEDSVPTVDEALDGLWRGILADRNHHIVAGFEDGVMVSSCMIVVVPNLTRGMRPYALIENVVTRAEYRNRGYATAILDYAKQIAEGENCYKIMLMTGSKSEATLRFYEKAGYNKQDKTAFIQWL